MEEKELEMVAGGAAETATRTATKETCFCCGGNQFILYLGSGGRAVCKRCGQGQIILEWMNAWTNSVIIVRVSGRKQLLFGKNTDLTFLMATPHNGSGGLRRIFCSNRAV